AASLDAGAGSHILERAVTTVAEKRIWAPVGDVEIESAAAIEIADAHAAAPCREIHACLPGDVLELPSAEVAIQGIGMSHPLTRRRELRRRHQIDVEQPIAIVVEQGEAAAGRFEDVILGGAAAMHLPRQPRTPLKGHR